MKHKEIKERVNKIRGLPEPIKVTVGRSSGTNTVSYTYSTVNNKKVAILTLISHGIVPTSTKDHHKSQRITICQYSFRKD